MDLSAAVEFARSHRQAVLTTIRASGRPQQSNVLYSVGSDGVIRVSITADRAKYANLLRDPWAALHVSTDDFWSYAVIEAATSLSPVAAAPDDATVEELVALYRSLSGEHSDWEDYRAAMVRDRRVVARLTPTRAYGLLSG